ncbi:MAG: SMI1/KNR4 family protein [Asticcacaulis sp.]
MISMARFITLWGEDDYPPEKVTVRALAQAEAELSFQFPDDYRQAVLTYGLPRTTFDLMNSAAEQDFDDRNYVQAINDFLSPDGIVQTTRTWREIGLPAGLVAIGSDPSGNLFCFPIAASAYPPGSVQLWLHDFDDVTHVADSFEDWLDAMCRIRFIEDDED